MVPYRIEDGEVRYLVISSALTKREHWEFPKGGVEKGEREIQTALRELAEETGVHEVQILPGFREPIRYIYRRPEGLVLKQVVYFVGRVRNPKVTLRLEEAKDYRWARYEEARKLLRHVNARALLERSHAFITGRPVDGPGEARREKREGERQARGEAAAGEQQPERRRRRRRRRPRRRQQQAGAPEARARSEGAGGDGGAEARRRSEGAAGDGGAEGRREEMRRGEPAAEPRGAERRDSR